MKDHLYFIESSCGHVKIGRATDVDRRLRSLLHSSPPSVKLTVLAVARDLGAYEYGMHERYKEHRLRGEWFDSSVLDELKQLLVTMSARLIAFTYSYDKGRCRFAAPMSANDGRRKNGPRWSPPREEYASFTGRSFVWRGKERKW